MISPQKLRDLRKRLGLTQAGLAEKVGRTASTVSRWERGDVPVPAAVAEVVSRLGNEGGTATAVTSSYGTVKDPHHEAILVALNEPLDADAFEACAADLLAEFHPGLVPIRGGADDGYDGAVPKQDGQPSPLITTTGKDLRGNLKRNLKRAISRGWAPTHAIFASSRRVRQPMRRALMDDASLLGVRLTNIYDQDWFANALYRNAAWCKKLLNRTGRPSALSVIPLSGRPLIGDRVIGREAELTVLREIDHDAVLVGPPGVGKTFVLRALALEGRALFVVDTDRETLSNAIREQDPKIIVVDDAHLNVSFLTELKVLRDQIHANFHILAVSWPAEASKARAALGLSSHQVVEIGLLDADQMVEVVAAAGVHGPRLLVRAIVRQADGRPGLAATLAYLCLRGDVRQVVSGESLAQELSAALDSLVPENASVLLGALALGGSHGISVDVVSRFLGKPSIDLHTVIARLAAAGVVRDGREGAISVWPEDLRWILVRDTFFSGANSLEFMPLFRSVPSQRDAIETLIGAQARGASVALLEDLLEEAASGELWAAYASLGSMEAKRVAERHPELLIDVADAVLHNAPDAVLPMLLARARGDSRPLNSTLDHPLRKIEDWVSAISQETRDVVARRRVLLRAAVDEIAAASGDSQVGIRAICMALDPGIGGMESDPGRGRTFTLKFGLLGPGALAELLDLWTTARGAIAGANSVPWTDLFDLVHNWLYPDSRVELSKEARDLLLEGAHQLIRDLVDISRARPGVQHRLHEMASQKELGIDCALDAEFEVLYPAERITDYLDRSGEWARAARAMAATWSGLEPVDLATRLALFEREAQLAGITYPRETPALCDELAADPDAVLDRGRAFVDAELSPDLVYPFLLAVCRERSAGYLELLEVCLREPLCQAIAVSVVITDPDPDPSVLSGALECSTRCTRVVEMACMRGGVPPETLELLFQADDPSVAVAAAIGHWNSDRRGRLAGLSPNWRSAILRSIDGTKGSSRNHEYWLGEILAKDRELAKRWLLTCVSSELVSYSDRKLARKALGSLTTTDRIEVLREVRADYGAEDVVADLVGGEADTFSALLEMERLAPLHLAPLSGQPVGNWREMALLALDSGHSRDDVATATMPRHWSISGPESAYWARWVAEFSELANDDDDRIAAVAEIGRKAVHRRMENCRARERFEAIHS